MRYAILCTFRPGGLASAKNLRLDHYEFLKRHKHLIVEGGPLLGPDGLPEAMLIIIDRETPEDARQFISEEPYTSHGLFQTVEVRPWRHVIPEPAPHFIESELEKERTAKGTAPSPGYN